MSFTSDEDADVEDEDHNFEKGQEKEKQWENGATRKGGDSSRDRMVEERLKRKRAKVQHLRHRLNSV